MHDIKNKWQVDSKEGQFNACSIMMHYIISNPMGILLPKPDPHCSLYFASKRRKCLSKLISPQLEAWQWRVWPESVAKKQIKDFFRSFATCKVLECRVEHDSKFLLHLLWPPKNRWFVWVLPSITYCSRVTQMSAANPLCTLVRRSS